METMCGLVANPVARLWNGLGQSPHFVSLRRNLRISCEGFLGEGRGIGLRGIFLWKQCVGTLPIQWHGCGLGRVRIHTLLQYGGS